MLKKRHEVMVDKRFFPIVNEGLWRVFEFGTAKASKIPDISMCGKTGTVQNSHGKDHAILVGFAPRENPKIAIAVVVENAGFGATYAAPIFSLMVEQYLKGKITRTDLEEQISNIVTNSNVQKR